MAKTITIDGVDVAQVVLMKDRATGKVVVRATYQVKAGSEVIKTTADRSFTFMAVPTQAQQTPDLMTSQEQSAASSAWDAIEAAVRRLELG